jgi:hypothetical protein
MENKSIRIIARRVQPEYEERYLKWTLEVYYPLLITIPEFEEISFYQTIRKNPEYANCLSILQYPDLDAQLKVRTNKKYLDIAKDLEAVWVSRMENVWFAPYEQTMSFNKEDDNPGAKPFSESTNLPLIHLEGYSLSNEEQEEFETWFNKWGKQVYVPLLMKSTGLKKFVQCKLVDLTTAGLNNYQITRTVKYPSILSIMTFDDIESFQKYESSLELAAYNGALQTLFPFSIKCQWYVQYQLVKSWRK